MSLLNRKALEWLLPNIKNLVNFESRQDYNKDIVNIENGLNLIFVYNS